MDLSLAEVLASLAAGGGTFLAARWILERIKTELSRRQRFFAVYLLSFGLATGAYFAQVGLGYVEFDWDGLLTACVTAFAASQALWGVFLARPNSPPSPPTIMEESPGPEGAESRLLADILPAAVANALAGLGFFSVQDIEDVAADDLARALEQRGFNGHLVTNKIFEILER